jgi:SecY interacting protein Syd
MSSPNTSIQPFATLFDDLINQYKTQSNDVNKGLMTYFENDWPSPCYQGEMDKMGEIKWRPSMRTDGANLQNLENALELTIPEEVHILFCRYYSHDINATTTFGNLSILQAWNEDDFDRLQKNLIAHVLMKRRLKQADTLFFALTDEEDFNLSILLETGAVVLEEVGKEPVREIAPNLRSFFEQLTPLPSFVSL